MEQFKVGIIGGGFVGLAHADALRRLPNVSLAALCTRNNAQEKAQAAGIARAYTDYKQMFDQEPLDAVHICSPNALHYEMAEYAIQKGIHVLCEKPMTATAAEAEKLLHLATRKGIVHGVNFHNRFYPVVSEMRNQIARGELGRIFSIFGGYLQDWLLYDTDFNWRLVGKENGRTRTIADIGTHFLDTVAFITGARPTAVFADFITHHPTRRKPNRDMQTFSNEVLAAEDYQAYAVDTEDTAFILARFDNGATANAVLSQSVAGKKNKLYITIAGAEKALEWCSEDLETLHIGRRNEPNQVLYKNSAMMDERTRPMIDYPTGHLEGYNAAFRHCFRQFYDAIERGGFDSERHQFATFEDGWLEMVLCDALYDSAQAQQWISL